MRRREFITLLGGAAVSWPLAARAQQTERMRRIGVVVAYAESDPEAQTRVIAFRQALGGLGWIEGRNVTMEYRWGAGDVDRARAFATELVSLKPDIILAHGTPAVTTLRAATRTIPVVFVSVIDPVGAGHVQSLARPGLPGAVPDLVSPKIWPPERRGPGLVRLTPQPGFALRHASSGSTSVPRPRPSSSSWRAGAHSPTACFLPISCRQARSSPFSSKSTYFGPFPGCES